jgi:hypothetical protein
MNCHPFKLAQGALVHNGTIWELGDKFGVGKSDTHELSEMLYDLDVPTLTKIQPILEEYIGRSCIAFLGVDGSTLVLNEREWEEHEGVLYSNDGYTTNGGYAALRSKWSVNVDTDWDTASGWNQRDYDDEDDSYSYFEWQAGTLYRWVDGTVIHDEELEQQALDIWFLDYQNKEMPVTEDEQDDLDWITTELIESNQRNKENTPCSTSTTSSPPTATTTVSSLPTSPVPSPSPSSATARSAA